MAEDIFEKVKRAEKEISRVIEVDRARIAIGASSIIAEPLLPSLMKDFSSAHEEIEYNVTISNKEHLLKLLKEGELTNKQIAQKFNVSISCINSINTRHRWKHLTTDFIKNIRKESKGE